MNTNLPNEVLYFNFTINGCIYILSLNFIPRIGSLSLRFCQICFFTIKLKTKQEKKIPAGVDKIS